MAGKEHSGIEHADPALFHGAAWLLTPLSAEQLEQPRCYDFADLLSAIGARVVVTDLAQHDRLCAFLSHLPQLLSTALGATLADFLEEDGGGWGETADASFIGGRALRETTRLAASPYSMWRDIAFTNTQNIEEALHRLEQHLAHIRENLRTPELRAEFDRARQLFNAETQRKERSNKQ
jgi:prephenate dehydrogenase